MNRKRITLGGIILALIVAIVVVGIKQSASARPTHTQPVDDCVPAEAYTETIEHPEVSHEETIVVQEAVDAVWANFQPNDVHAPFVGPPSYPSDERGSWNVHNQLPPGHEGPDGVYSKGNPHKGGNWFYRQAAVEEVTETVTIVDEEAWVETIEHPAVVCEPPSEECPRFSVPNENGDCELPPCPETGLRTTDCMPSETPEEPQDSSQTRSHSKCVNQHEVMTRNFTLVNGVWEQGQTDFRPAKASDGCKVETPAGGDTTSHFAAVEAEYGVEEGM